MATESILSRETILDTAEQVLRRYGDKTNVVDVAKVLRVSHGTIYRHFASKAALLEAVTERWLHRISLPLEAISNQQEGSAVEQLLLWLETLIHSKQQSAADEPELFSIYAAVTSQGTELIQNHVQYLINLLSRIVEQGIVKQVFKNRSPESTARAIFMATARFHHPAHAYEGDAVTKQHDFELVWQLILSGIVSNESI
ncbi:transcriptional regulator, TetR family [Paenibacillus sp. 1_12]|uniref:TetR family transcriptional regulator n=1 Tax=Paenibacillus sp. 1_12 TaxID=1566278 RepID=UPI0008E4A4F9|nr:TetR family transcriptional regulator [Paenibacillus sp. 1_12]SFK72368.1 transcriptional regulator, TetR family [Paenibacillus sp. 1_12]